MPTLFPRRPYTASEDPLHGAAPMASVVFPRPDNGPRSIVYSRTRTLKYAPVTPTPVVLSNAENRSGGPIANAIVRPWYWGWNGHRQDRNGYGHVPIPVGKATGNNSGWNLSGGSIQAPRPRLTRVLRLSQFTTAPPSQAPTGPGNG